MTILGGVLFGTVTMLGVVVFGEVTKVCGVVFGVVTILGGAVLGKVTILGGAVLGCTAFVVHRPALTMARWNPPTLLCRQHKVAMLRGENGSLPTSSSAT